ncbi:hypothetical protein SRS16CHR_05276 [Variovorax sp. SRS16]|nr:hypothetical protein SRS16CHR_05276 [Variovorax sp. SRS16]
MGAKGAMRTILGAPFAKKDEGNPEPVRCGSRLGDAALPQLSCEAQSTSASKAGRAAVALPLLAIATTTQRWPLAPST